jgi:twitching motility two-component system response regulator PilG
MQGQLSEIDIRSILQLIELGQRTGELFVEAYAPPGNVNRRSRKNPSWFVFFLNGQIVYAGETDSDLSRLRDYLHRYRAENTIDQIPASSIATFNTPEYGCLWALLENHLVTPAQGRSIIQGMVRETLFDLLSLHQGSFIFELGNALTPQLLTMEIAPLARNGLKQVQEWKQLHPYLHTTEQSSSIQKSYLRLYQKPLINSSIATQTDRPQFGKSLAISTVIFPRLQGQSIRMFSAVGCNSTPFRCILPLAHL